MNLIELRQQLMFHRYSPDQPRDPDGKFGEGDGSAGLSRDDAKALFGNKLEHWLSGYEGFHEIRQACADSIKAGVADRNPLAVLVRTGTVSEKEIYRGMGGLKAGQVKEFSKVGSEIQIMPSSFSKDKQTAAGFADEMRDRVGGGKGENVVFTVVGGDGKISGLDVAKEYDGHTFSGDKMSQAITTQIMKDDEEIVSGGRFQVLSSETHKATEDAAKCTYIKLKQVGVF